MLDRRGTLQLCVGLIAMLSIGEFGCGNDNRTSVSSAAVLPAILETQGSAIVDGEPAAATASTDGAMASVTAFPTDSVAPLPTASAPPTAPPLNAGLLREAFEAEAIVVSTQAKQMFRDATEAARPQRHADLNAQLMPIFRRDRDAMCEDYARRGVPSACPIKQYNAWMDGELKAANAALDADIDRAIVNHASLADKRMREEIDRRREELKQLSGNETVAGERALARSRLSDL